MNEHIPHTTQDSLENHALLTAEEEVSLAKTMEAGLYAEKILGLIHPDPEVQATTAQCIYDSAFYSNVDHRKKLNTLTPEEAHSYHEMARQHLEDFRESANKYLVVDTNTLEAIIAEGKQAKERFALSNIGLAKMVAYRCSSSTDTDLDQAAFIGLLRGIEKFDFTLGNKFSTMGFKWIHKYVREAIDNDHLVRLPTHLIHMRAKVPDLSLASTAEVAAIAAELNIEVSTLMAVSAAQYLGSLSVDFFADAADNTASGQNNPEGTYLQHERSQDIRNVFDLHRSKLSERDQRIVDLYFLDDTPYQEISVQFELSPERIKQIVQKFSASLRPLLTDANLSPTIT